MSSQKKYSVRNIVNEIETELNNKDLIKLINKLIFYYNNIY